MNQTKKRRQRISAIAIAFLVILSWLPQKAIIVKASDSEEADGNGTEIFSDEKSEPSVIGVKVNTSVRPAGHCLESLEVTVGDAALLNDIQASDFSFSGQAAKWMDSSLHDFTADIIDASVDKNVLTLKIANFTEKYFYVDNFKVTCAKNDALSFTNDFITEVVTPIADDFKQIRKKDGAAFDYNIYIPQKINEPLPVVV